LNNIISVAATDQDDALATFSNHGVATVDVAAPGVNILSTLPLSSVGTSASVHQSSNVYSASGLTYAGITTGVTATIYDCGLGYPTNFPLAVSDNIALIERGTLFFSEKVANAMSAGAVAAVIYNNTNGNFIGTLQTPGNWIPAVSISQADGQSLWPVLPATGTVINGVNPNVIYQVLDGTSMAAPHVAGAVAFTARNFPGETVAQRIQRILTNATSLPNLQGVVSTGARLNLARTVDTDGNGLPDWWEQIHFNQLTGTDPNADSDDDKMSHLAEWLAGTNPTNAGSVLTFTSINQTTSNTVALKWPAVEGKYYRLLGSTGPLTGFNHVLRTNIAAKPPFNTETETNASSAMRFYRLQVEP
jgi:subtilisin family serine protease